MNEQNTQKTFKREDFVNNNEVRWCPGCGDYAILAALQKLLPELGLAPEKHVFVSGIGCAGRFPYYMNTYGFHTIHGRATAIATGLKALRDDLSVWVITGDGDALSIGTNHLIHCLRRNANVKILLFNNEVYGLTKGQFSPTSKQGQITRTSPHGVVGEPINPLKLALAAGASFVAKAIDKDPLQLGNILQEAYYHQGCAFIEIYQDCNIFNNGAFDKFSIKANRAQNTLVLKENEPLLFGDNLERSLIFNNQSGKIEHNNNPDNSMLMHDPSHFNHAMHLAELNFPEFPVPLGVYYRKEKPIFSLNHEVKKSVSDLIELYKAKTSWHQD